MTVGLGTTATPTNQSVRVCKVNRNDLNYIPTSGFLPERTEHCVDTRVVASRGFGSAAHSFHSWSLRMFHTPDTRPHLCSSDCLSPFATKSCGAQTLPAQTSRCKPLVRDVRLAQVFNSCNLLPCFFGLQVVF